MKKDPPWFIRTTEEEKKNESHKDENDPLPPLPDWLVNSATLTPEEEPKKSKPRKAKKKVAENQKTQKPIDSRQSPPEDLPDWLK